MRSALWMLWPRHWTRVHPPPASSRLQEVHSCRAIQGAALLTLDVPLTPQGDLRGPEGSYAPERETTSHSSRIPSQARPDHPSFPGAAPLTVLSLSLTSEGSAPGNRCTSTHFLHES